jgi:RNA polymerase sigma factor (sigma-70 family)
LHIRKARIWCGEGNTFRQWYENSRCKGSPRQWDWCLRLGYKIWREDFPEAFRQEEVENEIIFTLTNCFYYFDRAKGKQGVPSWKRFLKYFAFWWRRRLARGGKRAVKERRKWVQVYGEEIPAPGERVPDKALHYQAWARFLFLKALRRMDGTTRKLVKLRYLDGCKAGEIAGQLGISTRTISRYTSQQKVVKRFRREVQRMVLSIPECTLQKIVFILHYDNGFSESEIARLLCVSVPTVERILLRTAGRIMAGLEGESGMKLFAGAVG